MISSTFSSRTTLGLLLSTVLLLAGNFPGPGTGASVGGGGAGVGFGGGIVSAEATRTLQAASTRILLYWPDSGVNAGKKVDKEEPEVEEKEEEEATPTEDEEVGAELEEDSDEVPEEEEAAEVGLAQGAGSWSLVKSNAVDP
jgi:hypothetical protein